MTVEDSQHHLCCQPLPRQHWLFACDIRGWGIIENENETSSRTQSKSKGTLWTWCSSHLQQVHVSNIVCVKLKNDWSVTLLQIAFTVRMPDPVDNVRNLSSSIIGIRSRRWRLAHFSKFVVSNPPFLDAPVWFQAYLVVEIGHVKVSYSSYIPTIQNSWCSCRSRNFEIFSEQVVIDLLKGSQFSWVMTMTVFCISSFISVWLALPRCLDTSLKYLRRIEHTEFWIIPTTSASW